MHALTVRVAAALADAASDLLAVDDAALSVTVEDADAGSADEVAVFDEPGQAGGAWRRARITALYADESGAVGAAARLAAGACGAEIEAIAAVDERNWVLLSQAEFPPIEIDPGFWIVPSWAEPPAGAECVIRLDPGMAFGTGSHPTTRMCLRWLARHAAAGRLGPGERVLDYGCGSGILAIAAARLGATAIDAVDIDPAAVAATRANAAANAVALNTGDAASADGRYALVVANILATPLKLLAPLLCGHLAAGGRLLLSGILERQAGELADAYAPWLPLAVADRDDGWVLMAGQRPFRLA